MIKELAQALIQYSDKQEELITTLKEVIDTQNEVINKLENQIKELCKGEKNERSSD